MPLDPRITAARSLEELLQAVQTINAECFAAGLDTEDFYPFNGLPTYGGEPLERLEGLFSWDATRVLVGDTTADMAIETREDYLRAIADE